MPKVLRQQNVNGIPTSVTFLIVPVAALNGRAYAHLRRTCL